MNDNGISVYLPGVSGISYETLQKLPTAEGFNERDKMAERSETKGMVFQDSDFARPEYRRKM